VASRCVRGREIQVIDPSLESRNEAGNGIVADLA